MTGSTPMVTDAGATTATGPPLLEVHNVSKRFGGVQAVVGVSLTVTAASVHGIIGSNGAGKTTLLSLISGAQRADEGEITFAGRRIERFDAPKVARLGIARAHQVPKPFRQMSVREHLDVAARANRLGRHRRHALVGTTLERCGLTDRADRLAGSLGLLDLKRLGVARALATGARLLMLDEIAAGLTGPDIETVVALVDSMRNEGTTIIMVEHIQGLIRRLADRVTVLEGGQVLREGTPAEIAEDPAVIEAYLGTSANTAPVVRAPAGQRPDPLLRTDGLSVTYGALPALRKVGLQIGRAEVVGVVGANGAGKSTLARALAGLERSAGGSIAFDGADITAMRPHERARRGLALCPEGRRLFGEMSVEDNLRVAARRGLGGAKATSATVDLVLELFPEIQPFRHSLTGRLSGGQQQMVAICRSLAARPKLVIFDELSLGLAPIITNRIIEAIPAMQQQGVAVLLIEQNVAHALSVCDHVYVLERSRVTFDGSPTELADSDTLRAAYFGERAEDQQPPRGT
ncbi:MAG: ATP-binding cassette domain-containing protein [Vicinamibacterales bacterium]